MRTTKLFAILFGILGPLGLEVAPLGLRELRIVLVWVVARLTARSSGLARRRNGQRPARYRTSDHRQRQHKRRHQDRDAPDHKQVSPFHPSCVYPGLTSLEVLRVRYVPIEAPLPQPPAAKGKPTFTPTTKEVAGCATGSTRPFLGAHLTGAGFLASTLIGFIVPCAFLYHHTLVPKREGGGPGGCDRGALGCVGREAGPSPRGMVPIYPGFLRPPPTMLSDNPRASDAFSIAVCGDRRIYHMDIYLEPEGTVRRPGGHFLGAELLRTPFPRTQVNKGKRKGWILGPSP